MEAPADAHLAFGASSLCADDAGPDTLFAILRGEETVFEEALLTRPDGRTLRTSIRSTPGGVARATGPAISVTRAPAPAAAFATATG